MPTATFSEDAAVRPVSVRGHPVSFSARVRSGAIWNMATTMLLRLASIGITAIVAHILSPHDFGVFAVATTAFSIAWSLSEFGITSCITRTDLDVDACAPTMLTVSLASNVIAAGSMVVFAKPIAASLGSSAGANAVKVMALVVLIGGISAVPTGQCFREFRQRRVFLANALSFFPSTVVLLVLAKTGSGAMAFAWSRVTGQAVSYLVILLSTPRKYRPGFSRYAMSVLWQFGIPLACANFVGFILLNVDYVLIGHSLGAVMLGIYVLAFNVASWSSTLLTGVLSSVAMPAFSKVKDDPGRLMDAMALATRTIVLVAAPACALLMALARPLVLTLYGPHWAGSAYPLSVLSLYGLIYIVNELFVNMLAALGVPKLVLAVRVGWLAVLIPAMTVGVRLDGVAGAAMAHIAVIVPLVLPAYLIALKRATGVRFRLLGRAAFAPLAAAALAGLLARLAADPFQSPAGQLASGITAGGLGYGLATGSQLIGLLGPERLRHHRGIARIMRMYRNAGRALGMPSPSPRHRKARRRS